MNGDGGLRRPSKGKDFGGNKFPNLDDNVNNRIKPTTGRFPNLGNDGLNEPGRNSGNT